MSSSSSSSSSWPLVSFFADDEKKKLFLSCLDSFSSLCLLSYLICHFPFKYNCSALEAEIGLEREWLLGKSVNCLAGKVTCFPHGNGPEWLCQRRQRLLSWQDA